MSDKKWYNKNKSVIDKHKSEKISIDTYEYKNTDIEFSKVDAKKCAAASIKLLGSNFTDGKDKTVDKSDVEDEFLSALGLTKSGGSVTETIKEELRGGTSTTSKDWYVNSLVSLFEGLEKRISAVEKAANKLDSDFKTTISDLEKDMKTRVAGDTDDQDRDRKDWITKKVSVFRDWQSCKSEALKANVSVIKEIQTMCLTNIRKAVKEVRDKED